ncbi:hypothetical protein LCGC14_1452640 [marine sediment metagenome]|uniref:Uncharacterized protein n=1 Tax=marine sediment metagenome TaxID=412755 RepID=A0A0F9LY57_9ZZZZ
MALDGTLTKISQVDVADREQLVVDITGPSQYDAAAGGEPVLPSFFPFRTGGVLLETVGGQALDAQDGFVSYDPVGAFLQFYDADGVEVLNDVDKSGTTYRLTVNGR